MSGDPSVMETGGTRIAIDASIRALSQIASEAVASATVSAKSTADLSTKIDQSTERQIKALEAITLRNEQSMGAVLKGLDTLTTEMSALGKALQAVKPAQASEDSLTALANSKARLYGALALAVTLLLGGGGLGYFAHGETPADPGLSAEQTQQIAEAFREAMRGDHVR